jgi:hypothetical protein
MRRVGTSRQLPINPNPMKTKVLKHAVATARVTILGLGCVSLAVADIKSDEAKQRILTQAQSAGPDDYAFTRTVRSESTSNGKTEQHVNVDKFDPSKSGDARWTLISIDGAPPAAEMLARYQKDSPKRRVPGYYRLAKYFSATSTASTDSRGRTVFHFNSLPKDSAVVMDSDVSSNTSADVTVSEANGGAFAEQVHLSVKPMRLKLIMKLDRYESTARYRMGPDGKPLLVEHISDMSGSGMGQEGKIHSVATYSDYHRVEH